jgi:hypothetical protein
MGQESFEGPGEDGTAGEGAELLRNAFSRTGSATGGDDEGDD